jgi:putative restriction endonuclease
MDESDYDTLVRMAAFEHVRRLNEVHDHLTATELRPGFIFAGERIPLINPPDCGQAGFLSAATCSQ